MREPVFENWVEDNSEEIGVVARLLSEPLSDNPAILTEQITKIEAWGARMVFLLADCNSFLDLAERDRLPAREERMTDLDRRTLHKAAVVKERNLRDRIQGLVDAIQGRVILGQSLMKRNAGERLEQIEKIGWVKWPSHTQSNRR